MLSAGAHGLVLAGELKGADVARLHAQGLREFAAAQGALRIDLAGVAAADSAVLAMLVDWFAWARQHGRSLEFHGAPQRLRALAALSDVDHWLFDSASGAAAGSTY